MEKHLQVQSDCTAYKVELWVEYKCFHCMDKQWIWTGEADDIDYIKCPFCNTPNLTDDES